MSKCRNARKQVSPASAFFPEAVFQSGIGIQASGQAGYRFII
jgi:hypothetical protein